MSQVPLIFTATDATAAVFNQVRGRLNTLGNEVVSVRGLIATLTGAFSVGAFAAGIKGASEAADAAAKMGDRFGIATEKVIGMKFAGELAGAGSAAIATGLKTLATVSVEAARGSEEAALAFKTLGITASEFVKLPMDQQFRAVIDGLGKIENATLRNATANKLLGKSYGELMGLVAEGAEAFDQAQRDADAFGLAVNRVDAAKLELANDAITRAQRALQGLFTTIAIHVAPIVKVLADRFSDAAVEANGFRDDVTTGMQRVANAVGAVIWFVERLQFAWAAVKVGVAAMGYAALEALKFIIERMETVTRIAGYIPGPIGIMARAMNGLAKASIEGITEITDVAGNRLSELNEELSQIATGSATLEEWQQRVSAAFAKAAADVQAQADVIATARKNMMGEGPGEEIENEKDAKGKSGKAAWKEQLAAKLERIREQNMSELELLQEKFTEANLILQAAVEADLITVDQGMRMQADTTARYEKEKTRLTDEETKRRWGIANVYRQLDLQSATYFLDMMSGMMASKSRTMFEVGKAAAIGKTVMDTYSAAMGAYAALASIPYVGPFLGAAAAAAAIVTGMAQVQKIKSTQFQGGGGASPSAPAMPTFSANPNTGVPDSPINPLQDPTRQQLPARGQREEPTREVSITFVGGESKNYSYREVAEEIIPLINEAAGNGVNVTVRST